MATCVVALLVVPAVLTAGTVLVTNTDPTGNGSLFQAANDANSGSCTSPCLIAFAIPGPPPENGQFVIRPTSNITIAVSDVTIDGTTEAAFLGVPATIPLIAIDGSGGAWDGLTVIPAFSDIGGIAIRGLNIRNFVNGVGINVHSTGNYWVNGARIAGNVIGIAPDGTLMPNKIGIVLGPNAQFGGIGVEFQSPVEADRNVVSGNTDAAMVVSAVRSSITGNLIGTDSSGLLAAPNGAGIIFDSGTYDLGVIPAGAFPNVIAFNHGDAIRIAGGSTGIHILRNSIHSNAFGINLFPTAGADGPTPNDVADSDTGGNGVQNFPVLTSKTFDGVNTVLGGTFSTTPGGGYTWRIDFYANTLPNASGYGEGESWIGETNVAPDVAGNATFSVAIPGDYTSKYISTTAAMSGAPPGMSGWVSSTSEFSQLIEADLSVTMTGNPNPVLAGGTIAYDLTVSNAGPAAETGAHVAITFDAALSQTNVVPPAGWICLGPPIQFPPPVPPPPMVYDCQPSVAVPAGSSAVFQATAVAPTAIATVITTAEITALTADPNPANNGPVSVLTNVNGIADLAIAAVDTPDPVLAGGTISYAFTLTNGGPTSAQSASVSFTINPAAAYDITPPAGWACFLAVPDPPPGWVGPWNPAHLLSCAAPAPLPPGAYVFTGWVTPSDTSGTYVLTVRASAGGGTVDPNLSNNGPFDITTVIGPAADLSVTKDNGVTSLTAGTPASWTITVANAGPSPVIGATITDAMPASLMNATWTCTATAGSDCASTTGSGDIATTADILPGGAVTYVVAATVAPGASGSIANTATVAPPAGTTDSAPANNSATDSDTIAVQADLNLQRTVISPLVAGTNFVYSLQITNGGPSSAWGVRIIDILSFFGPNSDRHMPLARSRPVSPTLLDQSWTCTASPGSICSFGSGLGDVNLLVDIEVGGTITIEITAPIPASASGTLNESTSLVLPAGVTDPTPSGNSSTLALAISTITDLAIAKVHMGNPARGGDPVSWVVTVWNNGPSTVVGARVRDLFPAGVLTAQWVCEPTLGAVCGTASGTGDVDVLVDLMSGAQAMFLVDGVLSQAAQGVVTNTATVTAPAGTTDPDASNDAATDSFTVAACPDAPQPLSPLAVTLDNPTTVTFSWTDVGAGSYELFISQGDGSFASVATSTAPTVATPVGAGTIAWYVVAITGNCRIASAEGSFTVRVCLAPEKPVPYLVGEVNSDEPFTFSWTTDDVDVTFEFRDSAGSPEFGDAPWTAVTASEVTFKYINENITPVQYWFQVRAVRQCPLGPSVSDPSPAVRIVIRPAGAGSDSATVEEGQEQLVNQLLRICATAEGTVVPCNEPGAVAKSFTGLDVPVTITSDRSWMTITPSTTTIPPGGTTVTVTSNPQGLPTGTNTGSVVVTQPGGSSSNVPFSVNIVTPVSPQPKTPPRDALIIPAVAHVDGLNSKWQSDIRVTNLALQTVSYEMTFTPSGVDGTQVGRKTEIEIGAGETKALDDIVKQWYGLGALSDGTNGVLEIRPSDSPKRATPEGVEQFATVASSRTYNTTPGGTYGQWIPAVPFAKFIGRALEGVTSLTMQQIAQSARYRTNLGLVEGAGAAVKARVSVFDAAGNAVTAFEVALKPMEHQQLNGFLAARDITLENGRVDVSVTDGEGRITAYASVIDAQTNDPLLVPGIDVSGNEAPRFVLPGVANLDTGTNRWRSDIRIFNPSSTPLAADLIFYAQNEPANMHSASITLAPGQIAVLDDAIRALFGLTGIGGAIHVVPAVPAPLAVSGRTYDLRESGTYGQFIPAVTAYDAAGVSDRALEILQIEQSDRYRTNLGLVEVTGKPAVVEISAIIPAATVVPKIRVSLAANAFTQIPGVLQQMNLGTVYNARLSVKVIEGEGRVSAYGSVIDQRTQDPTYVPAQ